MSETEKITDNLFTDCWFSGMEPIKPNERFEKMLLLLVGDNVGANCRCSECEANRQAMRDVVAKIPPRISLTDRELYLLTPQAATDDRSRELQVLVTRLLRVGS